MISGFSLLVVYTPESASFALNVIATFILFQPWSSGKAMTSMAVTVGATVSRRIVTERVAVPPLEVAEQVNVTPAVSSVTDEAEQPLLDEIVDSASLTDQLAATSLRYHPSTPASPLTTELIT